MKISQFSQKLTSYMCKSANAALSGPLAIQNSVKMRVWHVHTQNNSINRETPCCLIQAKIVTTQK